MIGLSSWVNELYNMSKNYVVDSCFWVYLCWLILQIFTEPCLWLRHWRNKDYQDPLSLKYIYLKVYARLSMGRGGNKILELLFKFPFCMCLVMHIILKIIEYMYIYIIYKWLTFSILSAMVQWKKMLVECRVCVGVFGGLEVS